MLTNRIIVAAVTVIVLCACLGGAVISLGSQEAVAGSPGPALGKWEFTGRDSKGGAWKGTLTVEKLDTARFDAPKYYAMFVLDVIVGEEQRGIEAPCRWDPVKREVAMTTGPRSAPTEYTATLSPDGKTLTGGRWTESERDSATGQVKVTSTGTWTAKFVK